MSNDENAELVRRAAAGDQRAWRELVRRYGPKVCAVARAHRLNDADVADVGQNTWLSLAENLGKLRDPSRLSAWLATTARRESLRILALRRRELVTADDWSTLGGHADGPERCAVLADQNRTLWTALASLPPRCQRLLRATAYSPELTYVQIGQQVGITPGSVGQTRGRCLSVLRRRLAILGLGGEPAA